MSRFREIVLAGAVIVLALGASAEADDIAAGKRVFNKCKACHAIGANAKNRVGPELNELIGRTAGTAEGYRYSSAMKKAGEDGLVWSAETLRTYLAKPRNVVKGTKMTFPGLRSDGDIDNIIAYLSSFSTAPEPAGGGQPAEQDAAKPAPVKPSADAGPTAPAEAAPAKPEVASARDAGAGERFHLGRTATEDEVAAWDIDVRPDGLGLPDGHGTVAEGETIFDANCAQCHGDFGEAVDRWPVLAGGQGTLRNERPVKTIGSYWPYLSTVYDYVRRAMPFGNARSLSDDDVYALTAYLLYLNDIVQDENFELSKANFTSISLPNAANFIDDNRASEAHYADRGDPCMTDCLPGKAKIVMHAAVLDVTPEDHTGDTAQANGIE